MRKNKTKWLEVLFILFVTLLCIYTIAGTAHGQGSSPPSPHRWRVLNDSTLVLINRNASADTFLIVTDSLGISYIQGGENGTVAFLDLLKILDFALYTGGANIAAYDTSDVPVDGDAITWNTGDLIDWQPAGGTVDSTTVADSALSLTDLNVDNWKVLYTNGTGEIIQLTLGATGELLKSNGPTSAPTFSTALNDNPIVKGQLTVNGPVAVLNEQHDLFIGNVRVINSSHIGVDSLVFPVNLEASDDTAEAHAQMVHPSILYFPGGFEAGSAGKKFRYILEGEPLGPPAGAPNENPHVYIKLSSDWSDHSDWDVKLDETGTDSIPMPIVHYSDHNSGGSPFDTAAFLADGDLAVDKTGKMWCVYHVSFGAKKAIGVIGSTDLVTWATKGAYALDTSHAAAGTKQPLSPALLQDTSGSFIMFLVQNAPGVASPDTNRIVRLSTTNATPESGWVIDSVLSPTLNGLNFGNGNEPWHIEVVRRGADELFMLVSVETTIGGSNGDELWITRSGDNGFNWDTPVDLAMDSTYRSTGFWVNDADSWYFRGLVGTNQTGTGYWHTYPFDIRFDPTGTNDSTMQIVMSDMYGSRTTLDSATISLEFVSNDSLFLTRITSTRVAGDQAIACAVSGKADMPFHADSLIFEFRTSSGTATVAKLDEVRILQSSGVDPQSMIGILVSSHPTDQSNTVLTRIAYAFNVGTGTDFAVSDMFGAKFNVVLDQNEWFELLSCTVKGWADPGFTQ